MRDARIGRVHVEFGRPLPFGKNPPEARLREATSRLAALMERQTT